MDKTFGHDGFFRLATRCWHAALGDLRDGRLWDLFEDFARRFPDHPSEENTHVYLTFRDGDSHPSWELFWRCTHFERCGRHDLPQLIEFLDGMGALDERGAPEGACVELLDHMREEIQLSLQEPPPDIREHVMARGRELGEWREGSDDESAE